MVKLVAHHCDGWEGGRDAGGTTFRLYAVAVSFTRNFGLWAKPIIQNFSIIWMHFLYTKFWIMGFAHNPKFLGNSF